MSENFENFSSEDVFEQDVTAQKIIIPEKTKTDKNSKNKGIKVFCLLLAFVFLLSIFCYIGYSIGRLGFNNKNNPLPQGITLHSKPTDSSGLSVWQIYETIADSVVGILVYNDDGMTGEASGVIYSEDGLILTNDHIYSSIPSAKFKIFLSDGTEYNAYYLAGDTRSDLAVLKIDADVKLKVAKFGNSEDIVAGESVCVIGRPNGYNSNSTITLGIVSCEKVRMSVTSSYSSNFIQTDAAINPGNSGGALVNSYGQIIGITSCKIVSDNYEGVGYAIPTKTVQKVADSLIKNGNVKNRAKLGISYYSLNSAEAEINGLLSCGLLVDEVSTESSLFSKLERGDIITHINDIKITDDSVMLDMLEEFSPGDSIKLSVLKSSGKTEVLSAKLLNDEGSSSYVIAQSKIK